MDPARQHPRGGDNKINFFIYYEVDGDTSTKHHLSASNYGPPRCENEWVLLTHLSDHLRWCVLQPFLRGSGKSMPVFLTDFG